MKIQHKITLVTCFIFCAIFAITSIITYTSFVSASESVFYKDLSRTAEITGMFYLEKDELNTANYTIIKDAFYKLNPDRKITIYDQTTTTAFNTETLAEIDTQVIDKIRKDKKFNFSINDTYYHGLFYQDNQGDFVVIVSSKNQLIQEQKKYLIAILSGVFCFGMLLMVLIIWSIAKYVYSPVRAIIKQVDALDLNNDTLLLSYPKTNDELEELFEAFNKLLNEIKFSYLQQKNFVDHASHELKTPLAAIINNLEVTLQKPRTNEEYQDNAKTVLNVSLRLKEILKNLLLLSSIHQQVQNSTPLRIDEILWEIIASLQKNYGDRFQVSMNIPAENATVLQQTGNETLLYMAMYNIIENAAKFSTQNVLITLSTTANTLTLSVQDKGIGIPVDEHKFLRQPFFRASNSSHFQGNGLGLSITYIILEAHHIKLDIQSKITQGTTMSLYFH